MGSSSKRGSLRNSVSQRKTRSTRAVGRAFRLTSSSTASGLGSSFAPVPGSDRDMRRLLAMETGPPTAGGSVDAVGVEPGHAGVIDQWAGLVVARSARDLVAQHQSPTRPGPPLPRAVGAAEEDHRRGRGRRRKVGRAGVGAEEQVGPLQEPRRSRSRRGVPSSRGAGRGPRSPRRPRHRPGLRPGSLASRHRGTGQSGPASDGSASASPPLRHQDGRPERGGVAESTGVQRIGLIPGFGFLSPGRASAPSVPLKNQGCFRDQGMSAVCPPGPGIAKLLGHPGPVAVGRVNADPGVGINGDTQAVEKPPGRDSTSCRPGTHRATSVRRKPPPPIAQPSLARAGFEPGRGRRR